MNRDEACALRDLVAHELGMEPNKEWIAVERRRAPDAGYSVKLAIDRIAGRRVWVRFSSRSQFDSWLRGWDE